ncbi:MAG: nitrogenase-stabilizing/protective protein NifW [Sulfurimonas sp.]|jgi:nitrogenase-stabilizing/protective protein
MTRLQEFETLTDTEEFFEFFDVAYDEKLVYVKRFHIMKKYGEMLLKAKEQEFVSDEIKLNFYKFALISVYKNFENGYAPSAADIWSMFDNPSACGSCSTATSCNSVEEVSSGVHACTSQPNFSFH